MVYSDEINLNSLLELRQDILREQKNRALDNNNNFPLPVLVFAIKALSLALKEYPMVNSTLNSSDNAASNNGNQLPTSIRMHTHHNIGVAMDTPRGLAVPVLHHCEGLSLRDMAVELERLKQAARTSQLTEQDLSGATITLSNIGAIGGTYMSPIITPPQVAILTMGRVQKLPRFVQDHDDDRSYEDDDTLQVQAVQVLPISWGGDHRVLDGATLARFSNQWKYYMESPTSMLLHLK
jgi:2-oxoisovalerate dehydrogenase E2 component (dihydrolipoyl transacylase)